MASSSRARSSSPFSYRKPSSPYSSTSSSSSLMNGRIIPRSCSTSATSFYNSGGGLGSRSMTPSRGRSDSMQYGSGGYSTRSPVGFASEELLAEMLEAPRGGDSISVTIRFRPLSEREFQRGDEITWYADGDKIVRNEYNPATAYAFDRVFGQHANSQEVYEVAAKPVVKAAMEGVNGTVFAYGVTSSGKTHTMHGDQNSPGIIPLAIKDVFSIIQDTPGREFLLRVSYLEIYNEVINDLLDPTGQNLRVREDSQGTYVEGIKEEVVLSPGHALSFIAAGEEHRHVGSNNFNLLSSRSHTIFTLMIESSAHGDEYDGVIFSQLNLIDLAGSESSKTETTGLRRKEGSYINKSLLTLGTLTRLLQSSLGGHGHVSLICTVTPASSSMEETHNTLKFASRAKRVEIYASRNKIIDEKSLIKKYQREISVLKEELDQLRKGMLVGISHEEIITLKQKLEEGQFKMQSRLEEEEEAKAALMSRIQRLTKLILVSSKNTIPGCLGDIPSHQRSYSVGEDDVSSLPNEVVDYSMLCAVKVEVVRDGPLLLESENQKESPSSASAVPSDLANDFRHKRSSSRWNDDLSPASTTITESTQAGELISGSRHPVGGMTMSDHIDLLVEQVKMLAGEIALGTSSLKRLVEQSVNDPDSAKTQIENLERDIHEKRRQMRVLEQRINESGEASIANASFVEMQQTVKRLTTQCNEKGFELECNVHADKSADNRILQEQLQNKCAENVELHEKVNQLERRLASVSGEMSSEHCVSEEYVEELKKKIQSQEIENEKLKLEHVYLKNMLRSSKRKFSLSKIWEERRLSGRANEISGMSDDFESWNLDADDLKMELQARKQREAALEAALAEKEFVEEEYRKKVEDAKKREEALENDLANMWVLVAKLKKEGGSIPETHTEERHNDVMRNSNGLKTSDSNTVPKERQILDVSKPADDESPTEEPLVLRLKARMQEMKDKELKHQGNGDANSHLCKCVNLVHLLVPSAQFVVQKLQIGFLHLPHNTVLCPQMKGLVMILFYFLP
ncbi:Kinesin motor family protein [Prunus dulcis]|uniref:Kinesin motor family protein n=1 Tax=Prunus dulcis TaxID=3755 RepID=A0A4Y1RZV7_PRUDU|nr:Kinesin motor family protein [Prunus dulcis]